MVDFDLKSSEQHFGKERSQNSLLRDSKLQQTTQRSLYTFTAFLKIPLMQKKALRVYRIIVEDTVAATRESEKKAESLGASSNEPTIFGQQS